MPTLKVHYEGWVSLPSGLRRELGLSSGDRLEVQLVEGAIVLRPASKARAARPAAAAPEAPVAAAPSAGVPARRGPGRPRKLASSDGLVPPADEAKRPRGRPRKAVLAPEPEPVAPSLPRPASPGSCARRRSCSKSQLARSRRHRSPSRRPRSAGTRVWRSRSGGRFGRSRSGSSGPGAGTTACSAARSRLWGSMSQRHQGRLITFGLW